MIIPLAIIAQGKKLGSFSQDYFKRPMLRLDNKYFYIVDQGLKKGFIYDRTNFKKIAEFGREGQGPGEFTGIASTAIDDKYIYISSFPKLCIFSKEGKLIKELKGPFKTSNYFPFGGNFVGTYSLPSGKPDADYIKLQIVLFDEHLKKKKDLFLTEIHSFVKYFGGKEYIYWIRDCFESVVYKDKLYVGTTEKGFYFSVFNLAGDKLNDIKRDEKKREITGEEKKAIINGLRLTMGGEKWKAYKATNEIIFADYYPAYKSFFVNDDKIYVFLFPKYGIYEILVLDLKGNLLARRFILEMVLMNVYPKYNCIDHGKFYQVRETDEEWELHEVDLLN